MAINLIDDLISAGISTVLALGISLLFYRKGNRDAFKQDIMEPIKCMLKTSFSDDDFLKMLVEKKIYIHFDTLRIVKK